MICFDIPLLIVAAFLILNLVVGIYFSGKKATFRTYAVGNKNFATATLVATVLATTHGGEGLTRGVNCVYDLGLWWIVFVLLGALGFWIVSRLALRMGPFMQHLSMAETIGSIYGRYPRIIVALFGICSCIIVVTIQINVINQTFTMCLGSVSPKLITILSALLLIFYSTFGGIRAVTFTDVLQFITFSFIIPLLSWLIFTNVGKPFAAIFPMLGSQAKFQFSNLFHFNTQLVSKLPLVLSSPLSYVAPVVIQRVYMAASPMQARKVFAYATLFHIIISSFIILVGLFVFAAAPSLPKENIWDYIMAHIPPLFKGLLSISLLAMAMSTADSCLNTCAVMVAHDIVKSLQKGKASADADQLKIAKGTTLAAGLLAMLLAFCCQDLLKLMYCVFGCSIPIYAAPFILAILGFRGTARTALIGIAIGGLTILAWSKWVEPETGVDGFFIAMVANGLAMMAAHYLLKQPGGVGWVEPDYTFIQMQQAYARKKVVHKEAIANGLIDIKSTLAKLEPSHVKQIFLGCYVVVTNLLAYFLGSITDYGYWLVLQLLIGVCLLGCSTFRLAGIRYVPGWMAGLCWVVTLSLCLPINVVWHWWHGISLVLTLAVSLAHLTITLLLLPLSLGRYFIIATLLMVIYLRPIYAINPLVSMVASSDVVFLLQLRLGVGLLILGIFIYFKCIDKYYLSQVIYLKHREAVKKVRKIQDSLYNLTDGPPSKAHGAILAQVVGKMEEAISFLDSNAPLYKQDFQSIINKLCDWVVYFNKRAKAKSHALLMPTKIALDALMHKVEAALFQEVSNPPKLIIEKINAPDRVICSYIVCSYIVCDINLIVYLLVQAIVQVSRLAGSPPVVRLQLRATALRYKKADPIDNEGPSFIDLQAIGMVISQISTSAEALPKVKECYDDRVDAIGPQSQQRVVPSINLQQDTISAIVGTHYGYLEPPIDGKTPAMLLILPSNLIKILNKITAELPIGALTSEISITPKERADSMMALMQFHDYVCKSSYQDDPIDLATISRLLLLLRQRFGFRRHNSGQLFYVRAVGIATLVVEWAFHSPKVIYASLLYELVRHTCLPLSYVKEHYNLGVYAFVLNVVSIDKREALDHPSLLYVQNRLKKAIKKDHIQLSVLFIKLAERLYDLRHAAGYLHVSEVYHMAQETLTMDVKLANAYLGPEIGAALEETAKAALAFCTSKEPDEAYKADKEQDEAG